MHAISSSVTWSDLRASWQALQVVMLAIFSRTSSRKRSSSRLSLCRLSIKPSQANATFGRCAQTCTGVVELSMRLL
ncbi:hypothetical protein D3C85_1776740 [compost metagenome]